MLKYVLIATLALIGTIIAAPQQDKGVDDSITVFGKPHGDQNNNQPTEKNFPTNTGTESIPYDPNNNKLIGETFNNRNNNNNNVNNNNSNNNFWINDNQQSGNNFGSNNQKDENCACVPYYQCQVNLERVGIIDRRQNICEDSLDVCCMPSSINRDPRTIATARVFQQYSCGQRHAVGFRITGAENGESQFGEFPWVVAILLQERISQNGEKNYFYRCGGSLIHRQVVLTTAHCVFDKNASELKIRAGEWDTRTENEILPHQDRDIQSTIIHENYNKSAFGNDYALLILKQPVVLADNVNVVCLPDPTAVFDGSRCFLSGWGKNIFGRKGRYEAILKRVELPIVNYTQCQFKLGQIGGGFDHVLHSSFICAGGEFGNDPCMGNGGSPLVCPLRDDPNRFVQAGSFAWGIHPCRQKDAPGVYSNIAAGRQWIDNKMNSLGFGTASYVY